MDLIGKFQSKEFGDKLTAEVREHDFLAVYRNFYNYYRPKLRKRFDTGSNTTPYAESSIGKRKRSGEVIQQVPASKFGKDTLTLYDSLIKNPKITDDGLVVRTDVPYAPYVLRKFQEKGDLAPNGVIYMDEDDLDVLETILIEEYLNVFG